MRFSTFTFTTLFAFLTALPGALISGELKDVLLGDGRLVKNVGYQGGGYYEAAFNDKGVSTIMFVPLAEAYAQLNITAPVEERSLSARGAYPVCKGRNTN